MSSKVLKGFIDLEDPEPIARSTPETSKYPQHQSRVGQLITMRRSNVNHPLITMAQSRVEPSSVTMPRDLSAESSFKNSIGPMLSVLEDQDDSRSPPSSQVNMNCSYQAFKRRGAMRKPFSPWRNTFEGAVREQKERYPLRRAFSADIAQSTLAPYNPSRPLINKFPLKKPEIVHLARARSIKTTIGPLTKEVCEQLNLQVELDNHSTKVIHVTVSVKPKQLS